MITFRIAYPWALRTIVLALSLAGLSPSAAARCEIPSTPCYPWLIEEGQNETTLLEVIPNNVATGAIYRVCICPPTRSIAIVFDFNEGARKLGSLATASGNTVCRDYRIQTARQSMLKLRRDEPGTAQIEGCYATFAW